MSAGQGHRRCLYPPGFGSPQALRAEQTGAWNTYAASSTALPTKSTTVSDAPSTPEAVEVGAGGLDGGGVEVRGVGREHGSPCVVESFGCRDEFDDAVGVAGVHASPSRFHCATPIDLPHNFQGDLRNIFASADIDFSLESGWKAADREPIRASVAALVFPTKSPLNWVCARWPESSLFGHWRSGVTFAQVSCRSTRRGVREHPAPSGALRQDAVFLCSGLVQCQGAPSTIRCIKTPHNGSPYSLTSRSQGAPSTIRCIKTVSMLILLAPFLFVGSGSTQHHQVH